MSNHDAAINIALRLVDQATAPMSQAMAKVSQSTSAVEQRLRALTDAGGFLRNTFASIGLGLGVGEVIKTADEYQNLHGRLRLVTSSAEELASVEKNLYAVSQEARAGYAQTIDLYSRIARSTKDLSVSDSQRLTVTDAINKSLIVSGAASESANAAIIQLSQGFASGTLRGEELNSVLEQAPRLAEAIAAGMGVSVGQLRELGKEGQLTAEAVVKALLDQSEAINREFAAMPKTVGQAMTVINNSMGRLISNTDQAGGLTGILAEKIISVASAMDVWGEKNKEATTVWMKDFKLGLMSVEAEIMRVSMLLDKMGGTMTFLASLPSAIPAALGIKSSQDRMQRMADYNIMYENRYAETDKKLLELAERYNAVESGVGASAPPFVGRTPPGIVTNAPGLEAIKAAKKLAEQWADTRRDLEQEINLAGLDGLDKELLQIGQRADDLRLKFGDKGLIDTWQAASEHAVIHADYLEQQKKRIEEITRAQTAWDDAALAGLDDQAQAIAKVKVEFDEYRAAIVDSAVLLNKPMEEVYSALDALDRAQGEAVQNIKDKTEDLSQFHIEAYRNMQDAGAQFFESLRTGSDDWLDNFTDMTMRMVDQWASAQMMMGLFGKDFGKGGDLGGLVGGAFTWASGLFGGGRASGGPVGSGMFYEVNENDPELLSVGGKTYLMMGDDSGYVTPPKMSGGRGSSGGGISIHNETHVHISGDAAGKGTDPDMLRQIGTTVNQVVAQQMRVFIVSQQRPGGLLNPQGVN